MPNDKRLEYIDKLVKPLVKYTPEVEKKLEEAGAQIRFDGLVVEKAKEIVKAKVKAKRDALPHFDNSDYVSVLNAYKRYKSIGFSDFEAMRYKKSIRDMFIAGYTIKEICDCMKFFKEAKEQKGNEWMRSWTIETIYKKMPEFKAGLLKQPELGDELPDL